MQVLSFHQNTESVIYGSTSCHDKLADWNGDLNGGHYNVIFIDMSATW